MATDEHVDCIYKKYGIDQNRIRTDAEIELFAEVFEISVEEARRIIQKAGHECVT